MHSIELGQQIDFAPLLGQRELLVVDEGDQLLRIEVLADDLVRVLGLAGDEGALVHRGKERAVPQRRAHRRRHVGTEHDISGQILVLGTEPIGEPRPERRTSDLDVAGVHHQHRRLVVRDVGVHRANHADVVGAGADVREQLADLEAALAVSREFERRLHQGAGLGVRWPRCRRAAAGRDTSSASAWGRSCPPATVRRS